MSARMLSLSSSMSSWYRWSISASAPSTSARCHASWCTRASSAFSRIVPVRSAITVKHAGTGTGCCLRQLERALGDVGGQVADALQLAVDLDHGDEEAQVAGHRLVEREDLEALLLDLHLQLVDCEVADHDALGLLRVALLDGLEREVQALLDHGAQAEHLALQLVELALQVCRRSHHVTRTGR